MPRITRAYTSPITANWTKCWGLHSIFAPASSRQARCPPEVGTTVTMAGRSTPFKRPKLVTAKASTAPELPALTTAPASPDLTCLKAIWSEDSCLLRSAATGESPIVIVWDACWMVRSEDSFSRAWASSRVIISRLPTRSTSIPYSRTAWTAPSTTARGAKSPPIASTAIYIVVCGERGAYLVAPRGEARREERMAKRGSCSFHSRWACWIRWHSHVS